jgi:hypothetical protein
MEGRFSFGWDFSRDMLWVRQLTIQHKPMLVGAWGSLAGSYFGPLYFYLLAIPTILSQGNPQAAVIMVSICLSGLIPLSYYWGRRWFSEKLGLSWVAILATAPIFFQLSLYSFPQQLIPVITILLLMLEWQLWVKPTSRGVFLAWLVASLWFHFEPADVPIFYLSLGGWLLYLIWQRKVILTTKFILASGLGGIMPYIPNLIFDLRHNWTQVKAIGQILTGQDQSLGGGLPLTERLVDRPQQFMWMWERTFGGREWGLIVAGGVILAGSYYWLKIRKTLHEKNQNISQLLILVGANILVALVYLIIFPRLLKDYYQFFLPVEYGLGVGLIFSLVINKFKVNWIKLGVIGLILPVNIATWSVMRNSIPDQLYRTQKQVVDNIYTQAQGAPFRVYTYTPLIYDYPYQYLFSWYGNHEYGYIPQEYAYKPNQPPYVLEKSRFDLGKDQGGRESEENNVLTFLIMEPGNQLAYSKEDWYQSFGKSLSVVQRAFPGGIMLETRRQLMNF